VNENTYLAARANNALAGVSGIGAVPLVSYSLGGAANNAPATTTLIIRISVPRWFCLQSSVRSGVLASIFGDRKTSIRAALPYSTTASLAARALASTRILSFSTPGEQPIWCSRRPHRRIVERSAVCRIEYVPVERFFPDCSKRGCAEHAKSGFWRKSSWNHQWRLPSFFQFDRNTKNPYAIVLNFGFQRELPGNFLLEAGYVGRLGRRLLAVGDAATITDLKTMLRVKFLRQAFGSLQLERENGVGCFSLTPQPWFENQMGGTANCQAFSNFFFGIPLNCTQIVGGVFRQLVV